jgi:hypothetical protein
VAEQAGIGRPLPEAPARSAEGTEAKKEDGTITGVEGKEATRQETSFREKITAADPGRMKRFFSAVAAKIFE